MWIHIYTDGSAKKSTTEGGGGIYLKSDIEERNLSKSIGIHYTNFIAESEALLAAVNLVKEHTKHHANRIVFLTDSLSMIKALEQSHCTEIDGVRKAMTYIASITPQIVIQWHIGA